MAILDEITYNDDYPGDVRFFKLLKAMWSMHCKKGNDYGNHDGGDFLANLRASEAYGVPAWIGVLIRANDKMIRLENAAKGTTLANESVEDSLMDLACYSLLSLILYYELTDATERDGEIQAQISGVMESLYRP